MVTTRAALSAVSPLRLLNLPPSMAETSESTSPPSKKRHISLSLKERRKQKAAEQFAKVSSKEMETCKKKPSCKNTDKSQLWAFCVFSHGLRIKILASQMMISGIMSRIYSLRTQKEYIP